MKKNILIVFTIITFIIFIPNVKADYGDVRYDVTELNIRDSKITFSGWAFIHKTHNFVSYKNGTPIESQNGNITNGDQKIMIRALDESGKQLGDVVSVTGSGNYNFYCQMYEFKNSKSECTSSYNGNFPSDYAGANNSCSTDPTKQYEQCLYEDIGFKVSFDTMNWDLEDGTEVKFQIAVHNTDYTNKSGRYQTEWKDLFLNKQVKSINDSDNIKILSDYDDNKVSVIAANGLLKNTNDEYILETSDGTSCTCTSGPPYNSYICKTCHWSSAKVGQVFKVVEKSDGSFVNGYIGSSSSFFSGMADPGKYIIYVKKGYDGNSDRYPATEEDIQSGNYREAVVWASWVVPAGRFKIKVYNDKKCKPVTPNIKAACNSTSPTFSSSCSELTVRSRDEKNDTKAKAEVKIEQSGIVSTILTPTTTYAGGGFKFGIIYYNTISWDIVKQSIGNESDIASEMQKKLKENFVNEFGLKNVKFGNEEIPDDYFRQNIQCKETGSFTKGNTLTTMCIVYLPNSIVEKYTGKVNYKTDGNNLGLSNKYYTPLTWDTSKSYEITATIYGMDRLKSTTTKADSQQKGTPWTGTWETTLNGAKDNCAINLYPLYGQPFNNKKNFKYIFMYRPISLNNPFPNRNAGMNWYDWYNLDKNKTRLENSYNTMQYSVTLDSMKTGEIKKYNRMQNSNGGYFDWNTIENGKSGFIDKYFDTKRTNIVGDN